MKSKKLSKIILILWFQSNVIFAQGIPSGNKEENAQLAEIAVIALGPRPPRRYQETAEETGPVMLLARPDETPPSRLFYRDDSDRGNDRRWSVYNLAFNNPTSFRKISPDRELRLHRKLPGEDNYDLYVSLPAQPPLTRSVFILMPSRIGAAPWEDVPIIKTLNLDNSNLADKQFILANFSQHSVQHAFENTVDIVKPDQVLSYQREQVGQIYRLAARYGNEQKIIYNTAVRLNDEGHAQLFVLYNADPVTNAGRDVGVFRMMIPAKKSEILP